MPYQTITEICRRLRQNETPQEKVLWEELRNRKFFGVKFRRQHAFVYQAIQGKIRFFVADFYYPKGKLIIELDGRVHDFQKEYDANRDEVLAELGSKTIRITNDDLENDLEGVLNRIGHEITNTSAMP